MTKNLPLKSPLEECYKTIIHTTIDGFWLTDLQGRFLDVNDAYCQLIGYTRDELLKMRIADVEAAEKPEEVERHIEKVIKTGGDRFETCHRRKNGELIDLEISVNYIKEDGGRLFVFLRDITEQKEAEEVLQAHENKYRTLLENLPQKIFYKDKNLIYVSCNENYARDLKIKAEEIIGKTDYDFFPKELAEKYREDDKRIMEESKLEDIEEKYIQDGQEVFVHTMKTPVRDEKNNVIGILGVFWDITKSKKAEKELKQKYEELERMNQLMTGRELKMVELKKEIEELKKKNA